MSLTAFIISGVIINILQMLVITLGKGVIYLAFVFLLEPILYALAMIYFRTKIYGTLRNLRFNKQIAISILKDSFPLIFSIAFVSIYARIDQVMIKNMLDTTSAGLYDAAVRISEVWYFIPTIILGALVPAIINAKKSSDELYYKRLQKLFITLVSISGLTALFTIVFSRQLILVIFGSGFIAALPVLRIYVMSNIGSTLTLLTQQLLIVEGLTKLVSWTTFLGMAVNVIINIIFIPRYGMIAAAYATLISYFIPFASLFLFKQSKKVATNIFLKR